MIIIIIIIIIPLIPLWPWLFLSSHDSPMYFVLIIHLVELFPFLCYVHDPILHSLTSTTCVCSFKRLFKFQCKATEETERNIMHMVLCNLFVCFFISDYFGENSLSFEIETLVSETVILRFPFPPGFVGTPCWWVLNGIKRVSSASASFRLSTLPINEELLVENSYICFKKNLM